jgi:hypothetical protein
MASDMAKALGAKLFDGGVQRVDGTEARVSRGISVDKWFSFLWLQLRLHKSVDIPL